MSHLPRLRSACTNPVQWVAAALGEAPPPHVRDLAARASTTAQRLPPVSRCRRALGTYATGPPASPPSTYTPRPRAGASRAPAAGASASSSAPRPPAASSPPSPAREALARNAVFLTTSVQLFEPPFASMDCTLRSLTARLAAAGLPPLPPTAFVVDPRQLLLQGLLRFIVRVPASKKNAALVEALLAGGQRYSGGASSGDAAEEGSASAGGPRADLSGAGVPAAADGAASPDTASSFTAAAALGASLGIARSYPSEWLTCQEKGKALAGPGTVMVFGLHPRMDVLKIYELAQGYALDTSGEAAVWAVGAGGVAALQPGAGGGAGGGAAAKDHHHHHHLKAAGARLESATKTIDHYSTASPAFLERWRRAGGGSDTSSSASDASPASPLSAFVKAWGPAEGAPYASSSVTAGWRDGRASEAEARQGWLPFARLKGDAGGYGARGGGSEEAGAGGDAAAPPARGDKQYRNNSAGAPEEAGAVVYVLRFASGAEAWRFLGSASHGIVYDAHTEGFTEYQAVPSPLAWDM